MRNFTGKLIFSSLILLAGLLLAGTAMGFSSFGSDVNTFCNQTQPFTGDCTLCHTTGSKGDPTPAKDAYLANDLCFFCGSEPQCQTGPTCTDLDQDGFFAEGTACGTAADCDDNNPAINPGAAENCSDGIDNNCNGLTDAQDPAAVGCPAQCTDADQDGFNVDGTAGCGPQDCNDQDAAVSPGAAEVCGDNIDNDCDGQVDEGCSSSCPDADADGFTDAACGGTDCDDADPLVNPGMKDLCGNGIDENCNGLQDDVCAACPGGGAFIVSKAKYNFKKGRLKVKGKATVGSSVIISDAETGQLLAADVPVKEGEWKARIDLDEAPARIHAESDAGCSAEQDVTVKGRSHHDDDDDDDHEQKNHDD